METTVLILTDFSTASLKAEKFALQLSNQLEAKNVFVFHAYEVISAVLKEPLVGNTKANIEHEKRVELNQTTYFLSSQMADEVTVESILWEGNLLDGLIKVSEEITSKLVVVMGISGKNKLQQFFVGSNAFSVMKNGKFPVFLVPEDYQEKEIKNLLVAYDFNSEANYFPWQAMNNWMDDLKAKTQFLNIVDSIKDSEVTDTENDWRKNLETDKASLVIVEGSKHLAIEAHAKETHPDLIVLIGKNYRFIDKVFHQSLTKKLAYELPIPLLVLPEEV